MLTALIDNEERAMISKNEQNVFKKWQDYDM